MFRRFVIMVGVLFLVCSHGWAFSEIQNESSFLEIQSQVFNLVNQNWVTNDIFVEMLNEPSLENQEKFFQAAEKFCRQSSMLGDFLVSAIQNQDLRKVEIVSEIYKSFDPIARQAFYPALRKLEFEALQLSEGSQDSNSAKFTRSRFREYFPGYGSTEPGYKYKKGKEISREIIGVTWENGKRSIVPGPVEITIDVNLL
ncbi:hypothetical protein HYY75_12985, partial [bacterium]|nr:hypothetical protein [bacterium]